ncbi:RDD family protein [Flavobacterium silvisoli]|uniref:RDD family protein n=1 Tax=Flavobacterium silvisoli TaxID=2529433 RepID=A0A4Q9Z9Y7_9FLAO|nr:RDD family protein [Flavobacterium silvisoli]TBX71019.1 RDD family protein [Flavobacterium silvisoli]
MESKKPFTVTEELLASHAQRIFNWLIDMLMQVVLLFVILVFVMAFAEANSNKAIQNYIVNLNTVGQYTLSSCVVLLYYNIFEIAFARTIGKFFTQTIVVDENGNTPDYQTIMLRSICRLIPLYGFSLLGMPPRGWHDSISKTYVVDKKALDQKKRLFYALQQSGQNE